MWISRIENGIRNPATGNLASQKKKSKKAIQNFNAAYLDEDVFNEQRLGMEERRLKYSGKDLETAVKRL